MVTLVNPPVRILTRRASDQVRKLDAHERTGVAIAARIGLRSMAVTITAFRSRVVDPLEAFGVVIARSQNVLAQVKLIAYLEGLRESQRAARRVGHTITLASHLDDEQGFLQRSLGVTDDAIAEISTAFGVEAAAILETTGARVQRAILETMVQNQIEGLHVREGVKNLRRTFAAQGITPRHSATFETIFRTEIQKSYAAGRWQFNQQPAVQEILWGYRYITAGDARVRPTHRGLEGVTLPKDHPRWNEIYPPNGFNCRCQAVELFEPPADVVPPVEQFTTVQDGKSITVRPGADPGFRINFGKVFVPGGVGSA